jgi:hypothetical protein
LGEGNRLLDRYFQFVLLGLGRQRQRKRTAHDESRKSFFIVSP